jgi:hypothetical protein
MDASYYDRKAAEEQGRLSKHLKDRAKHERAAANADKAGLKAEQGASQTKSPSLAKSKLREADRKRDAAVKSRERAAKASADAAASQRKVTEYETKAASERARQAKKGEAEQNRAARRAAEEQRRAERERERLDRARTSEVADLRGRTTELESQLEAARRAAPSQITVLLLAGTPEGGRNPLRLDREIREIDTKVRLGEYRDQIRFQQAMATQVGDIIDALNRFDPDVVHFSGHGGGGSLLFEGADGRPHALRGENLAVLLQVARKPIRLVLFNACDSADQAVMATDFVDVAIGMDSSIGDDAAKVFAGQFYGSLAAGNSVGNAFAQAAAQSSVVSDGSGDPQLFTGAQVDADQMILVAP